MNQFLSSACVLRQPPNRVFMVLGLVLFGAGLMLAASAAFAATPAPAGKPSAKPQSSEDVLKWLQLTGTKSANEAKEEKDQKAAKDAKETKELTLKAVAPSVLAGNPVQSATQTRALPVEAEKATVQVGRDIPSSTSSPAAPVLTVAAAASSVLTIPPEVQVPVAATVAPDLPAEPEVRILSRTQPVFPAEAQNNGVSKGKVTARLYVGTDGSVTRVEIVEASPKRVFDRAVTSAAMRWKFSPIPVPNATDVTFNFKVED